MEKSYISIVETALHELEEEVGIEAIAAWELAKRKFPELISTLK